MTDALLIKLMRDALLMVLLVGAPVLSVSLIVGLIVSVFQTTTSIQEQTLTFVPKIVAVFLIIMFFSSWMIQHMVIYTETLFSYLSWIGG